MITILAAPTSTWSGRPEPFDRNQHRMEAGASTTNGERAKVERINPPDVPQIPRLTPITPALAGEILQRNNNARAAGIASRRVACSVPTPQPFDVRLASIGNYPRATGASIDCTGVGADIEATRITFQRQWRNPKCHRLNTSGPHGPSFRQRQCIWRHNPPSRPPCLLIMSRI